MTAIESPRHSKTFSAGEKVQIAGDSKEKNLAPAQGRRILFVHERFGALGGAEANIALTAAELKQRGHRLALLHGETTGVGESQWEAIFEDRYSLSPHSPASIAEAVAGFAPDLIYVHKMADLELIESLLATGIPLVRMVHDHDLYCMRSYKYHYFTRKICTRPVSWKCVLLCGGCVVRNRQGRLPVRWASYSAKKRELVLNRKFDRLIVASAFMREELTRNGFAADRIRIHAPVPRAAATGFSSNFSDRNLILFTGQIIRGKGVDLLLRSLAQVKAPFECIILGEGNHRATCEKLSRALGLQDRVTFKGFVAQEELKSYYREPTLLAVSSVWPEPFGAVGLEAMRHGVPVVAFDAGGIKDWLQDGVNGFLIPWSDCARFAQAVDQLLADKKLARQMGSAGAQWSREHHDFATYIDNLEGLFSEVIHQHHTTLKSNTPAL